MSGRSRRGRLVARRNNRRERLRTINAIQVLYPFCVLRRAKKSEPVDQITYLIGFNELGIAYQLQYLNILHKMYEIISVITYHYWPRNK